MAQPYFPIHHKDLPQKVTIALQNPTVLWDRNDKHPLTLFILIGCLVDISLLPSLAVPLATSTLHYH
jgi:hypothetical protein